MSNESFTYDTAKALTANAFTRTGYTFGGWATSANGAKVYDNEQSVSNLTTTADATVNLSAKWTANTYAVKFNANGGSGSMSNESFTYDTAKALTANAFTRTGYTFAGWATSASGAKVYDNAQSVSNLTATANGTVNLYAKWTTNTYVVRFNKNATNATGTMEDQSFTYDVAKALTANAFARVGYTFREWGSGAGGGATHWSDQQVVSNLTATAGGVANLYVVWKANTYTVKFNANGGSGSMSNESFAYDTAKALTANAFAKTGYTFTGWATSASGAKVYDNAQSVSNLTATANGTVNLYAKWTANTYAVKFNANGGSGSMSNEGFTYDAAKALTANAFTRTGYIFGGWATSAGGAKVYDNGQSVSNLTATANGTVNLYAKWTANTYAVKFNANGGSGTMSNESFTYDTAKALTANAFTRTGYTFAGWATSAGGAKVYDNGQSVSNLTATANGTVNLYAKWTANTYAVKFNANTGSGAMSNESFTYDVAKALTANAFTRTDYVFTGWATSASGAKTYNDKQSVSNLTATAGATVNLYASWVPATYCVIDLSAGANASSYPVTYLAEPPSGGFNVDAYKTTKLVLKRIEAGSFIMGSNQTNESHRVTLTKPFYMGLFEVTQKQWQLVTGSNPSYFSDDKRPVEKVSYNAIRGSSNGAQWPSSNAVDSSSFLGKLRARTGLDFDLPTEAQWEYACRAGTTTTYSYGNSASGNYMWYSSNSSDQTHEVGTKSPNPWGLYDMHGNVWEWCLDRHNNTLSYGTDPKGPSSGSRRVSRGGGWSDSASFCTSSGRSTDDPSGASDSIGFRLSRALNQ